MNIWPKKLSVLGLSGGVYLVGQYFRGIWFQHLPISTCQFSKDDYGVFCDSPFVQSVGWPLIVAGEILAIAGIILLIANAAGLRRWFWMSLIYIPLAAGATIYLSRELLLPLGGTPEPAMLVKNFGYLYLIITLTLVLHARYAARRPTQSV